MNVKLTNISVRAEHVSHQVHIGVLIDKRIVWNNKIMLMNNWAALSHTLIDILGMLGLFILNIFESFEFNRLIKNLVLCACIETKFDLVGNIHFHDS